jgi:hypothetical protein
MIDMDAIMARFAAEQAELAALLPKNKQSLFTALRSAGVTQVTVDFDGCGDSGQIEGLAFLSGDTTFPEPRGEVVLETASHGGETAARAFELPSAIEHLVYELLEDGHGGWELNEGSYGTFTFDVADETITLDYNERVEVTNYSQHTY